MANRDVDVRSERPTVRRRAAAAIHSSRRARTAKHDEKALRLLATETAGQLTSEGPLERTTTVRQSGIHAAVDRAASTRGSFALDLRRTRLNPYTHVRYSRSGKSVLIASERGHVAVSNWRSAGLRCELFLNETVRDALFLHDDAFFAVAQRKAVYIYDASGIEVHNLRNHPDPGSLAFLPHHLLLASASCASSTRSRIIYTDTSTGEEVANHDFGARKLDVTPVSSLRHNATNGVLHAGHANGVVTLWSPTVGTPLARLFAQPGGVRDLVVDPSRNAMVTLGHDGLAKTWDLRTFRALSEHRVMPLATGLAISQRSQLAVCGAASVQIWRPGDLANPAGKAYLSTRLHGKRPTGVDFCPYEDVLGISHQTGMVSMLVPGAGDPNFDSRAPNPYMTGKQAREAGVRSLLDKLPAETIALDPGFVGGLDEDPAARRRDLDDKIRASAAKRREKKLGKKKMKGKNKISKRVKRAEAHNRETKRFEREERMEGVKDVREEAKRVQEERDAEDGDVVPAEDNVPAALNRFFPRRGEGKDATSQ